MSVDLRDTDLSKDLLIHRHKDGIQLLKPSTKC